MIYTVHRSSRLVVLVKEIRVPIVPHFLPACFDHFSMTRYQSIEIPSTYDSGVPLHESAVRSKMQRTNSLFVLVYHAMRRPTLPVGCNKKVKNFVARPEVG